MQLKIQQKKYYRLTAEGRPLGSGREKVRLPLDYRRILGIVDFDGHREVIASHLPRFPKECVEGWLGGVEGRELIEPAELREEKTLPQLAEEKSPPPIEEEDREEFPPEASY